MKTGENLSQQHAATLREAGYDAVAVVEVGLAGDPDDKIRAVAIKTGRVLMTLDADFANILRFPPAATPGVIRLKIHPPTEDAIAELLQRTVAALKDTPLSGCLAVAHREIIRIRR